MGKHRVDPATDTLEIPAAEQRRRTWPIPVLVGGALLLAVGIPWLLFAMQSSTDPPELPSTAVVSSQLPEPEPVPAVTATHTKTVRAHTAPTATVFRASPVPTVVYRDRWRAPSPLPAKTVKVTIRPTATITRCLEVDTDETIIGETPCP